MKPELNEQTKMYFYQQANHKIENLASPIPTKSQSYYRSQLFMPDHAINPLITCAIPLIKINNKLSGLTTSPNIHTLYQQLMHEVNAFVNKAQNRGYSSETILVAQYILCLFLDDTIIRTSWGKVSHWESHSLLSSFFNNQINQTNFFNFIEKILEEPQRHIELLEMIYLMLRLDFRGFYRNVKDSRDKLDQLADNIYQIIKQTRQEPQPLLNTQPFTNIPKRLSAKINLLLITLLAMIIILATYFGFNIMFVSISKPLQTEILTQIHAHNT